MNQCFYCTSGVVQTPPGVKSFEEFVDTTTVSCKHGKKTGCAWCDTFQEKSKSKGGNKNGNRL